MARGVVYTLSEQTQKNYTVGQAVAAATAILNARHIRGVCMNSVDRYELDRKITLVELNEISERVVDDSVFYS